VADAALRESVMISRKKLLKESTDVLELSVRSCNAIRYGAKIRTIGQLVRRTEDDLFALPNFGRVSLENVKAKLKEFNLALKFSPYRCQQCGKLVKKPFKEV
jgi:DNA-directed RNA polymerase subunit alpha